VSLGITHSSVQASACTGLYILLFIGVFVQQCNLVASVVFCVCVYVHLRWEL